MNDTAYPCVMEGVPLITQEEVMNSDSELTIEALDDVAGGSDETLQQTVLNGIKDSFDKGGNHWYSTPDGTSFQAGNNTLNIGKGFTIN